MTLREHIAQRIEETGAVDEAGEPLPVARAINRLCSRALAAGLIEKYRTWKPGKIGVRCPVACERALEELWQRMPGRVQATLEVYLATKMQATTATQ